MQSVFTQKFWILVLASLAVASFTISRSDADEKKSGSKKADSAQSSPAASEEVDVEGIKKKYWATGDESELGVVQNRLYSKARRFNLGVSGGTIIGDPFLTTQTYGVNAGYHFSEYFGLNLMYWKLPTSKSEALKTFEAPPRSGATANTNYPKSFYGGELSYSPLYGKLSLVGKSIIYYDFHLLGGGGITRTETGNYATGLVGAGQRFYLSSFMSLRVDYRVLGYKENIKEKGITTQIGQDRGDRMAWNHSISIGIDFFFGATK